MPKHCGKHDIIGDECWCCEEEAMSADEREAAYQDPDFLAKRGGADRKTVHTSHALNKLSQLSPEQIDRLLEHAGVSLPNPGRSGSRTPIAAR